VPDILSPSFPVKKSMWAGYIRLSVNMSVLFAPNRTVRSGILVVMADKKSTIPLSDGTFCFENERLLYVYFFVGFGV
jgi:hypothetical protein